MSKAKTLSQTELNHVLKIIGINRHSARNRMAVLLSFYAGMRACEIASLKISSVIDVTGDIANEITLTNKMTKGSQARNVIIGKRLSKELKAYLKTQTNISMDQPLLRSQKQNRPFSANALVQLFGRIYAQAGVCHASSHSGRRTFITRLASNGVSARVLQKLAGHSSLNTTQLYIDTTPEMLRNAVNGF